MMPCDSVVCDECACEVLSKGAFEDVWMSSKKERKKFSSVCAGLHGCMSARMYVGKISLIKLGSPTSSARV